MEQIDSIEALNERIQQSRQLVKARLYLTEDELEKEIQQWFNEKS